MMVAEDSRPRSALRAADVAAWVALLAWGIMSTLLMSLSFLPGTIGVLVWSPVAILAARAFERRGRVAGAWRLWIRVVSGLTMLALSASALLFFVALGDRWFWLSAEATIAVEALTCIAAIGILWKSRTERGA